MRPFDWLAIGLILSYVWRIQDIFPVLASVKAPILISVAALGLWLMEGHAPRALPRFKHPVVRAGTFILVWMVVSVPFSVFQGRALSFIINDHVKTYLMMLVVLSSIRGFKDVERLALANVLGAAVYTLMILFKFEVGMNGRLGDLAYYDANDLAMLIVCSLPLTIYFIAKAEHAWQRPLAAAIAGLLILGIVKTGSRGGFLGLLGVGPYILFGFRAIKPSMRFGAVAAAIVTLMAFAGPRYWEMMATLLNPKADYNWSGNNDVGRMAIWKRGMGYMMARPIFGVGANDFPIAEGTISALAERQMRGIGLKWSAAHNSFVQIGAELGFPGLLAFLLMLWHIWKANRWIMRSAADRVGPQASMAQALQASLIGYLVCGFFLSQAYGAYLYALCAMVVGFVCVTAAPRPVGGAPARRPRFAGPGAPMPVPMPRPMGARFGAQRPGPSPTR